ncbi:MAG: hypothetical protein ACREA9_24470 [Pyrinomonadaceae bacterium]
MLDISSDQARDIGEAQRGLLEILNIEEKSNVVLENYADFERELLTRSLDAVLFSDRDWSSSVDEIHTLNRRLVNFLSTGKLYLDATSHNIKAICGNRVGEFKTRCQEERKSTFGFRALEWIRDHGQHRGLPIHGVTHTFGAPKGGPKTHSIAVIIDVNKLRQDRKGKDNVLAELQNMGASIDITPLLRSYLESFFRIHRFVRSMIDEKKMAWKAILLSIQNEYRNKFGDDGRVLAIVTIDESDKIVESFNIFDDLVERIERLTQKNQLLMSLSFIDITTAPPTSA